MILTAFGCVCFWVSGHIAGDPEWLGKIPFASRPLVVKAMSIAAAVAGGSMHLAAIVT